MCAHSLDVRVEFVERVLAGIPVGMAGVQVGISGGTAREWASVEGLCRPVVLRGVDGNKRKAFLAHYRRHHDLSRGCAACGITVVAGRELLRRADIKMVEPALNYEARDAFRRAREKGVSVKRAREGVGVSYTTGYKWERLRIEGRLLEERPSGCVLAQSSVGFSDMPTRECVSFIEMDPPISKRFLSVQEREFIADLCDKGWSIRRIAGRLGRAPSTISREVRRGRTDDGLYLPRVAQRASVRRRARPKTPKLVRHHQLRDYVQQGLAKRWSPTQISARVRVDYEEDESMRVSPETIYQAIYVQSRGNLKKEVLTSLRRGKTMRVSRGRKHRDTRGKIQDMVMISQRPPTVEDRAVPGHWEGDLIIGKNCQSAIGTLVERSSRFTMLFKISGTHDAHTVRKALAKKMMTLPENLRKSLTWDQGIEMIQHAQFQLATNIPVYFCDPHSPWQRGSNENTNGLLRQYFPKGTDLSVHSQQHLDNVAAQLNGRPRQTLNWATPAETMHATIEHDIARSVATTD